MRLQSWRGTAVVNPKPRRKFPWVRILIVAALLGIAAYLVVPNIGSVRADALVRGDLIPVTPLYRARVERLLVGCAGNVKAGQPLAIISNFLVQADYQREYLQALQASQLAGIALDQNVATANENAESLRGKYEAASADENRVVQSFRSFDDAYKAGAIPRVDWEAKQAEVATARAQTRSALDAWKRAQLYVQQITVASTARMSSDRTLLAQAQNVANRVGQETVRAPVTGDIVDCIERPENVIEPGTAIFSIFEPQRAYIVAYFNPNDISYIHVGQKAKVRISGFAHDVEGRVAWIYPNLDALPPELTRFFWQHVQFAQFRPVKIALDTLSLQDRQRVYYGAQARVSIAKSSLLQ